jgi:hypothetical protein
MQPCDGLAFGTASALGFLHSEGRQLEEYRSTERRLVAASSTAACGTVCHTLETAVGTHYPRELSGAEPTADAQGSVTALQQWTIDALTPIAAHQPPAHGTADASLVVVTVTGAVTSTWDGVMECQCLRCSTTGSRSGHGSTVIVTSSDNTVRGCQVDWWQWHMRR